MLKKIKDKLTRLAHYAVTDPLRAELQQQGERGQSDTLVSILSSDAVFRQQNMRLPIRVVIIVYAMNVWDNYDLLYKEMQGDADFDPIIMTTSASFAEELRLIGVEAITLDHPDEMDNHRMIRHLAPHIIFYPYMWLDGLTKHLDPSYMSFARICYIPYASAIIPFGDIGRGNYWHNKIFRYGWMIFMQTREDVDRRSAFFASKYSPIQMLGYPKHEGILKTPAHWPMPSVAGVKPPYRIIWSPHHTIKTPEHPIGYFGTFLSNHRAFVDFARQHPEVEILLRMHPLLMGKLSSYQELLDQFLADWQDLPNTGISHDSIYGDLFNASDMLITDGVSWLMEYQLVRKPIIFIDREGHQPSFLNFGHTMLEAVHRYPTLEAALPQILDFAAGAVDSKAEIMERNYQLLYQEGAATRIKDAIKAKFIAEMPKS
jgi:CDP-Glycerol:Poly(glycerophosphate) glycerophosphotransferase